MRVGVLRPLSRGSLTFAPLRSQHRLTDYLRARLAFTTAMVNLLPELFHQRHPEAAPFQMSIAEFS